MDKYKFSYQPAVVSAHRSNWYIAERSELLRGPSNANSGIGKIRLNRFLGSINPSIQPPVQDLGRPPPRQGQKAESQ